jgi:hypothetical protein
MLVIILSLIRFSIEGILILFCLFKANHPDTSKSKATNNVLIGDNTKQYVIHLPTGDNDDDYSITKNIVVGDNTSQYIIATFRTSKELIAVLREMKSTGTEGNVFN